MKTYIITILMTLVCQALFAIGIEQNLVQNLTELKASDKVYFVISDSENAAIVEKSFNENWNFSKYEKISPATFDSHEYNDENFYIRIHELQKIYGGFGLKDLPKMMFVNFQKGKNKKKEDHYKMAGNIAKTMNSSKTYNPFKDKLGAMLQLGFFMEGVTASEMGGFGEMSANLAFKQLNTFFNDVVEDQTDDVYKIATNNSTYLKGKTLALNAGQIDPEIGEDEAKIKAAYPYPIKIVKMEGANKNGMVKIKMKPSKKGGKPTMEEMYKMAQEKMDEMNIDNNSFDNSLYGLAYVDQYNPSQTLRVYDRTSGKLVFVTPIKMSMFSIKGAIQIFTLDILKEMAKAFEGKI